MNQSNLSSSNSLPITVIGAGIAGTWHALMFARAGHPVTVLERDDERLLSSTSHWAGGMLAPWCEREATEPVVSRLGVRSLELWREEVGSESFQGSLVVAHARDRTDFQRFANLTTHWSRLDAEGIAKVEPALEGQFHEALYFPLEGHVEPRAVLPRLHRTLGDYGADIRFNVADAFDEADGKGLVIDCRGLAARDDLTSLRGVKGEMALIETTEIELARPVRLIHPRWSVYIIPRPEHRFMIGATTIETEDTRVSVRSALELLGAAYAVHPAFGEARIVEIGAGLRPAFPDNLPHIDIRDRRITVNGLYRHGFLLAPALAELTLSYVTRGEIDHEVMQCV